MVTVKATILTVFVSLFSKAIVENGESNTGWSQYFMSTFLINCYLCLVPEKLSLKINL